MPPDHPQMPVMGEGFLPSGPAYTTSSLCPTWHSPPYPTIAKSCVSTGPFCFIPFSAVCYHSCLWITCHAILSYPHPPSISLTLTSVTLPFISGEEQEMALLRQTRCRRPQRTIAASYCMQYSASFCIPCEYWRLPCSLLYVFNNSRLLPLTVAEHMWSMV